MSWRASIDDPAVTDFGLKRHQLIICPSGHWPIDNSDLTRLQRFWIWNRRLDAAMRQALWQGGHIGTHLADSLCSHIDLAHSTVTQWEGGTRGMSEGGGS